MQGNMGGNMNMGGTMGQPNMMQGNMMGMGGHPNMGPNFGMNVQGGMQGGMQPMQGMQGGNMQRGMQGNMPGNFGGNMMNQMGGMQGYPNMMQGNVPYMTSPTGPGMQFAGSAQGQPTTPTHQGTTNLKDIKDLFQRSRSNPSQGQVPVQEETPTQTPTKVTTQQPTMGGKNDSLFYLK